MISTVTSEAIAAIIAKELSPLAANINVALRALAALSFRNFNAYDLMTQTSAGNNKEKQIALRSKYFEHFGLTMNPNDTSDPKKQIAVCVLTGRTGGANTLKLAHLVPASAKPDIKETLQLQEEDIWGFRNVLLLSWNIERAFDRCELSFVPHPLREKCYYMKIWKESAKRTLIWDDATASKGTEDNTIGYYENRFLNLTMHNGKTLDPFRRCLAYQNFICFYTSTLTDLEQPNDFSSELGNPDGWKIKRNDLMAMRSTLDRVISSEAEDADT